MCKQCGSNVTFSEASNRGLGFKVAVNCPNCNATYINASPLINDHAYDINRRIIFAIRLLGVGLHGIVKFRAFMELPRPIFHSFYDKIVSSLSIATSVVRLKSTQKAAAQEKEMCVEKGQNDGLIVSGDGSWRKRGFPSLFGLVSLIGWYIGKVVDVLVKSKYCKSCEFWKKKKETAEYEEWAQLHEEECQANHEGSAGKMEVDAVIEMFHRSERLHKVKYAQYIGDGDCKTFKGILDAQPYENFIIRKKECIDHIQKRMGTRLRTIKKSTKGLGGKGKLTGKLIDELTIYYGLAIRRNHDCMEKMKEEIWATLFNKISTDDDPQHDKCPIGEKSWCSWQKAKALNQLADYKHKPSMKITVFNAIKPAYEELSRDDLLNRCLGGYTQNNNESFNSVVWSIAPKTSSSGKLIVDIAADIAVCTFNDGLSSLMHIMELLHLQIGQSCYNFCQETDTNNIKTAERAMSEKAKEARKSSRSFRKEAEEADINLEGQLIWCRNH